MNNLEFRNKSSKETITIKCRVCDVKDICAWYDAYHVYDNYSVSYAGRTLLLDQYGVPTDPRFKKSQ